MVGSRLWIDKVLGVTAKRFKFNGNLLRDVEIFQVFLFFLIALKIIQRLESNEEFVKWLNRTGGFDPTLADGD